MSNQLCLNNENDIFKFLLSRNTLPYEEYYLSSINSLEKKVNSYVDDSVFDNLIDIPRNFNIDCTWINHKYKNLVKLKITLDLITSNIISFYEKNKN